MSVVDMTKQLEQILNCSVSRTNRSLEDIAKFMGPSFESATIEKGQYIAGGKDVWLIIDLYADYCEVIEFYNKKLSPTEMQLIAILLLNRTSATLDNQYSGMTKFEKQATKLGEWLESQVDIQATSSAIPEHLIVASSLFTEMIPILLTSDSSIQTKSSYIELDKLLRSFLSEDVLLIPLRHEEWLIWGPSSLLRDEDILDDTNEAESIEDTLSNIALGLHDMLTSEWIGECHLSISYPVVPAKFMVETIISLRDSIHIGRQFHVGNNLHLPWMLRLESLLHAIPEVNRQKYLEQSLKRTELFVEPEMLATLETFFSLDCNVSETAKKLYIHRNTLLYRLDKLKHETGLDVRLFRDAVLVKIILLLYKVTKTH